jgi:uncharacterized OsmC-like protein
MTPAALKDLLERRLRALRRRPSFGRSWEAARVHLPPEGACEVRDGAAVLAVDLAPDEGGAGGAPRPGELMRASLGASLALGYRLWAARLGVAIGAIDIDVACEYDTRGQLDAAEALPAGWQRVVLDVRIASDAPEADVHRVVETADRMSPMLGNLSPAVARVHRLTVVRG